MTHFYQVLKSIKHSRLQFMAKHNPAKNKYWMTPFFLQQTFAHLRWIIANCASLFRNNMTKHLCQDTNKGCENRLGQTENIITPMLCAFLLHFIASSWRFNMTKFTLTPSQIAGNKTVYFYLVSSILPVIFHHWIMWKIHIYIYIYD